LRVHIVERATRSLGNFEGRLEMKRVLFIAAAILVVSVGVASADTAVMVGSGWHGFVAFGPGVPSASPFTFTSTAPVLVTVTDVFCVGDRYTVSDGSTTLGTTSVPLPFDCNYPNFTGDPDTALADPNYSHGRFAVEAGEHSIGIVWAGQFGTGGGVYVRFDTLTAADCANGGWQTITASPLFTSERDCIAFVSAPANAHRISRGDAEAVFQAIGGSGAVLLHSPTGQGLGDALSLVRIRAFGGSNGQHFCSLDWHVVGVQLGEFGPYDAAAAELGGFVVTFTLDGSVMASTSTAVKRFDPQAALIQFGSADLFFKGYGAVVSPDALPAGAHTVTVLAVNAATGESLGGSATFYMDPSGVGTCA
jgi:hypothetical protein